MIRLFREVGVVVVIPGQAFARKSCTVIPAPDQVEGRLCAGMTKTYVTLFGESLMTFFAPFAQAANK